MVLDFEKVELLLEYQNGVGAWVDLFDSELSFQTTAVKRAHRSPLIMNAICALTAKQLSMASRRGMWEPVAVRYYGESLHHLINIPMNSNTCREDTFAATILLSSHELASPGLDHRRHVSAALTLIKIHDLNSNSKGLVGASFWVYARQDIAMALVHECPTMLPPEEWYVSYAEQETADDRLGNQIIWCLARVIAFTFGLAGILAGILLLAKVPGIQLIIYEKNQDFV